LTAGKRGGCNLRSNRFGDYTEAAIAEESPGKGVYLIALLCKWGNSKKIPNESAFCLKAGAQLWRPFGGQFSNFENPNKAFKI